MPTYEYTCSKCGAKREVLQKISENAITACLSCKTDSLKREPGGGFGVQFEGSGFYETDYKKKQ